MTVQRTTVTVSTDKGDVRLLMVAKHAISDDTWTVFQGSENIGEVQRTSYRPERNGSASGLRNGHRTNLAARTAWNATGSADGHHQNSVRNLATRGDALKFLLTGTY